MTTISKISANYAKSLLQAATAKKAGEAVSSDVAALAQLYETSAEFKSFADNIAISKREKKAAMAEILKKIKAHDVTQNFADSLCANARLNYLYEVCKYFEDIYAASKGELVAKVTTAHALSDAQAKEVKDSLEKISGKKLKMDLRVRADILGGLIVQIGDKLLDDSYASKMDKIKSELVNI